MLEYITPINGEETLTEHLQRPAKVIAAANHFVQALGIADVEPDLAGVHNYKMLTKFKGSSILVVVYPSTDGEPCEMTFPKHFLNDGGYAVAKKHPEWIFLTDRNYHKRYPNLSGVTDIHRKAVDAIEDIQAPKEERKSIAGYHFYNDMYITNGEEIRSQKMQLH